MNEEEQLPSGRKRITIITIIIAVIAIIGLGCYLLAYTFTTNSTKQHQSGNANSAIVSHPSYQPNSHGHAHW
jgi:flagellar basal body-associated protein FliL